MLKKYQLYYTNPLNNRVAGCQKLQMTCLTQSDTGCFIAVPIWLQLVHTWKAASMIPQDQSPTACVSDGGDVCVETSSTFLQTGPHLQTFNHRTYGTSMDQTQQQLKGAQAARTIANFLLEEDITITDTSR